MVLAMRVMLGGSFWAVKYKLSFSTQLTRRHPKCCSLPYFLVILLSNP